MNRKNVLIILFFALFVGQSSIAQKKARSKIRTETSDSISSPKLVVGIVVDQMRFDYLTRFYSHYGKGGFKRLMREGFNCRNNHFNYAQTSTAPGHSSIYTGATPSVHGIIGNDWYDKETGQLIYCVDDKSQNSIGTTSDAGEKSPHRLNVSTVTDQLRLHHQMRSKVIAISIKDRGAVLPAGHIANGAYWFQGVAEGKWVSSSYYMDQLPEWVISFNSSGITESYKKPWNTLKDIQLYRESGTDNNSYEELLDGEAAPIFPHDLPALWANNDQYELLKYSPFGNSLTTDFSIAALKNENLGKDEITDFLAISYSSTDLVGHRYGVNSKEVQDTYLRLDLDLERLLNALDQEVGENQYTVFLTADHGAMHVTKFLVDKKLPGGITDPEAFGTSFDEFLKYSFGTTDIVEYHTDSQLFLNRDVIRNLDLKLHEVQDMIGQEILTYKGVGRVFTAFQLQNSDYLEGMSSLIKNGFHQKRSGDIFYILKSGYSEDYSPGSSHGSPYVYDTHVPLLFYGKGIRKGFTTRRTEITDVTPTIAALLKIAFPSGTTGLPIPEVLK